MSCLLYKTSHCVSYLKDNRHRSHRPIYDSTPIPKTFGETDRCESEKSRLGNLTYIRNQAPKGKFVES